jgi:hypothetical protein
LFILVPSVSGTFKINQHFAVQEGFHMMQENEIFKRVIDPLGEQGLALNDRLSNDEADELRETLTQFLLSAADENSGVVVTAEELRPGHDLKSIIYTGSGPKTNKLYAFTFKDAATEAAFPILGIVLAIYTGKWGIATIPQVAGVLKTLWSKLIILKRPEDADAIDVTNALVRVRTHHVLSGSNEHPTSTEIETDSGLPREAVIAALKTLRSRGVIEVSTWAGQTDDVNQLGNRWKVKL